MKTKAIFLDIDGVLNSYGENSKSKCGNYVGIDKDKVKRLAKIVQETDAILILTSSWKMGWEPKRKYTVYKYGIYEPATNYHAKYLDNHLKKKGKLVLTDKTRERNLAERGNGIKAYLTQHPEITDWIVLDDEIFADFDEEEIIPHLILTDPDLGLTDTDAAEAIKILNREKPLYDKDTIYFDPFTYKYKRNGPNLLKEWKLWEEIFMLKL